MFAKLFQSREDRFLTRIDKQYGDFLRAHDFEREPSGPNDFKAIYSQVTLRAASLRLRLSVDRGSSLFAEAAPSSPTGAWFDGDWYDLSRVVNWIKSNRTAVKSDNAAPQAAVLDELYPAIVSFFSLEGAAERERFVENLTCPPTEPGEAA